MKALYNKDHDQRVILGPHGLFIAQKTNHGVGRKADKGAKLPVTHNDPWSPIRRPTPNLLLAMEQAGIK